MANTIKIKRGSGSDPAASDMVLGEPVLRTDTAELFFKKDDGSVAKVSGGGGGPDFKYLALRNAANDGAASFPNADFTLVTSGTTSAITPAAANTLLVSVNGVIQKPNTGTSTPSQGFALSGSTIKFGANISAAPDFILYQESGGIGEPSDETVSEEKLKVSNSPVNGYFLSAQSGNTGGLTWAAPVATSCTGNSATATALATARTINGTSFDGTANITVTAAAGTLTGNTLNSSVTASSLTSLGDLAGLTVNGNSSLRHILVQADSTYDIGTTSTRYRNVYADAYYGDGSNLTGINTDLISDTSPQLGGLLDTNGSNIKFADSSGATINRAIFGTGDDLQIYHDGSDSFIKDTGTGTLTISTNQLLVRNAAVNEFLIQAVENAGVKLYYDNNKKLETTSTGVALNGNLELSDDERVVMGNSGTSDSHMRFDGTHLQIASSGQARFSCSGLSVVNLAGTETQLVTAENGAVELYHDNSKKLETTSAGVTVTGQVTSSTLTLSANAPRITFTDLNDNPDFEIHGNSGALTFFDATNSANRLIIQSDGTVDVTGNLGIPDNSKVLIGSSDDLQIYHDGTNSIIKNTQGQTRLVQDYFAVRNGADNEYMIYGQVDNTVQLYYDGSLKLNTTNYGAKVTGRLAATTSITGADNVQIKLGDSDDLKIYHDGSNSYIQDAGTGNLKVVASVFQVRNAADTETMIEAHDNGQVELYHNDTKVLNTANGGVQITDNLYITDGNSGQTTDGGLRIGNSGDLKIYHNGTNSYVRNSTGQLLVGGSGGDLILEALGDVRTVTWEGENMIYAKRNGAVELYHDNSKKFETTSEGVLVSGTVENRSFDSSGGSGGRHSTGFIFGNAYDAGKSSVSGVSDDRNAIIWNERGLDIVFATTNIPRCIVSYDGHFVPILNNTYDIGTSSKRWRNIYTNDLNLSNEGGSNDVDGTWGSYTIQEGAEDLFLVNKRNGKKYKFNLTEVS